MNEYQRSIHAKALDLSTRYRRAEAELLTVLILVEQEKIYRHLNKRSLFQYAVDLLGFSEAVAYAFITVARKSKEVPKLLKAVAELKISLHKARFLVAAMSADNADELIQFATSHSTREIQCEVARRNPKSRESLRIRFLAEDLVELNMTVSSELFEKLERVAALNGSNLQEAILPMADLYLFHKDPVQKAERNHGKNSRNTLHVKSKIPAKTKHELIRKTQGRCTHTDENGKRCNSDRYIEIHHIQPKSMGGSDDLENLTILCSFHHDLIHRRGSTG